MRTDRTEIIKTKVACWVGHVVGPLCYLNEGLILSSDQGNWHQVNLETIEWMTRCGLYPYISMLQHEIDYIISHIQSNGVCLLNIANKQGFKSWGPYSGGTLEVDWRTNIRRVCDVTFRALLILHHSKIEF